MVLSRVVRQGWSGWIEPRGAPPAPGRRACPRKLNALFHKFAEVGLDEQLGYDCPADLAERYPAFFRSKVEPVIGDAARFLDLTVEERGWVANFYAHIFAIEHDRRRIGPHPG